MGLQKFQATSKGEPMPNGGVPYSSGHPWQVLSLIKNCIVERVTKPLRTTVYATGHADTAFSIPAACTIKGKYIGGYITGTEEGMVFRPYDRFLSRIDCAIPVPVRTEY